MKTLRKVFTWHNCLKSVKSLFHAILKVVMVVNGHLNKNVVVCIGILLIRILYIVRKNGMTFAAKYLKSCGLFVMKAVGMKNHKTLHSSLYKDTKVSLCNGGLPRIIPSYLRNLIRKENTSAIRLVLSIFNLYRVMPFKGVAKLETITKPSNFHIRPSLDNYIPRFLNLIGVYSNPYTFNFNPFPIRSAGSVVETSESFELYLNGKFQEKIPRGYTVPGKRPGLIRN